MLASGLHPRVRSQANGSHYTSTDQLPLIPGVDGVGRRSDGSLVYFVLPDTVYGAMAEHTVIDRRRSIPLPSGADPVLLAAAMNPGMSSWVALGQRVTFTPGQSVLILGATGSAGQLAIQIAKHLGASAVVAAGRERTARRLAAARCRRHRRPRRGSRPGRARAGGQRRRRSTWSSTTSGEHRPKQRSCRCSPAAPIGAV